MLTFPTSSREPSTAVHVVPDRSFPRAIEFGTQLRYPILRHGVLFPRLKFAAPHFALNLFPFAFEHSAASLHKGPIEILTVCALLEVINLVGDLPEILLQRVIFVQKQIKLGSEQYNLLKRFIVFFFP